MAEPYAVLAPIYEQISMADFAARITPRLIDYAQRHEWMGRRVLDLGCGSGASVRWLCENRFNVGGVDNSPAMLQLTRESLDEKAAPLFKAYQQDIRKLTNVDAADLALALDVFNELESLREFEAVFQSIKTVLAAGKLFMFDLYTIEGLTLQGQRGDEMVYDDGKLAVFVRSAFDYERQISTRHFTIFQRQNGAWQRHEADRVLRAYPAQAVAALAQRSGMTVSEILTPEFQAYRPGVTSAERVIFVAKVQ